MKRFHTMPFGAEVAGDRVRFALWAPTACSVELELDQPGGSFRRAMAEEDGWFRLTLEAAAGDRYGFHVGGQAVPDPASRWQPDGVHGKSAVVDPAQHDWRDHTWSGRPWHEAVICELHVGTFTAEGTYLGAIDRLDHLVETGVTAIELMPLAQAPGARNWGYDGVSLFAPSSNYGTPGELKRLVEAAHARGLMVLLDVVYNHFGPEGNYLHLYAEAFFNPAHHTPWGSGINFDSEHSEVVRDFYLQNALYWLSEYHFDGLRLDAVDQIADDSQPHFLEELADRIRASIDRDVHLVLENDRNDPALLERTLRRPRRYTAQWNDDFHHACHALTTGEGDGYYRDYLPRPIEHLARCLAEGFAYQGERSLHRGGRERGARSGTLPPTAFVAFVQNHDQIGNRARGERLAHLVPRPRAEAAVAVALLSPQIPLVFMGDDWGASTPFLFFCDFEPDLAKAVREGRRREFGAFGGFGGELPDPLSERTLEASVLRWEERAEPEHQAWLELFRRLLSVRRRQVVPLIASGRIRAGTRPSDRRRGRRRELALRRGRAAHGGQPGRWTGPGRSRRRAGAGLPGQPSGGRAPGMDRGLVEVGLSYEIPRATYRLQLGAGFGFREARDLTDYLDRLGISHVYTSPYLKARAHSPHGYDVVDHQHVQPELGDERELLQWLELLRARGMGQIADFVPNHMGIGRDDNPWWLDVLEWGRRSPYAEFFDIDWRASQPDLAGKVLVPFLGDLYGQVLERGELTLAFDGGGFSVRYYEHRFPISPASYLRILSGAIDRSRHQLDEALVTELGLVTARLRELASLEEDPQFDLRPHGIEAREQLVRLAGSRPEVERLIHDAIAELTGTPGEPYTFQKLHDLLETQSYRLAHWRVAADEVNYRRFFDINELAALRTELPQVLEATHAWLATMIREGRLAGVRIDHVDGLYDPLAYLTWLRALAGDRPLYLVVEKILADHESLRTEWPVQGTTGYEFMNQVNGLFVDASRASELARVHRRFAGETGDLEAVIHASKRFVIKYVLSGELQLLASALNRVAERSWHSRDFTLHELRTALAEVAMAFPVYRTYVVDTASDEDRRDITWAIQTARKSSAIDDTVFDFIARVLTNDLAKSGNGGWSPTEVQRFAMKFQQYTGPLMAKALEDTAFYRYGRLLSLNEVGGHPHRVGISVAAFHAINQQRLARWPHSMVALSTHDAKRGADARARIDVISEIPLEWGRRVARWNRINRFRRTVVDRALTPADHELYSLYQTLLGSWPTDLLERPRSEALADFSERILQYMRKAMREAKLRSSWYRPAPDYECAVLDFVEKILSPSEKNRFLDDFLPFVRNLSAFGALNGLSQVILQLTGPGVPDLYRGTELWDLSLVDPDNRGPVDFEARRRMLEELLTEGTSPERFDARLRGWSDGRIKMFVIERLLGLRRERPDLFALGDYTPCEVDGPRRDHLCAFVRRRSGAVAIVIVSRLLHSASGGDFDRAIGPTLWEGTRVRVPDLGTIRLTDVLTGRTFTSSGDLVADRPFAVLFGQGSE